MDWKGNGTANVNMPPKFTELATQIAKFLFNPNLLTCFIQNEGGFGPDILAVLKLCIYLHICISDRIPDRRCAAAAAAAAVPITLELPKVLTFQ